jgi:hypothetical protein
VGGLSLAVLGIVVAFFIMNFDIPVPGRSGAFLLLAPGGIGMAIYGLILLWRRRSWK